MILAVFCALIPSEAYAQAGDRGGIDTVVLIVDGNGALISGSMPKLQYGMERALRKQRRLRVHDVDLRLTFRVGQSRAARLSEALGLLKTGEALLGKSTPRAAINRLRPALALLRELLAFASKRQLARAQFLVGVAHAMLGNTRAARNEFTRLLIWRPGFQAITRYAPDKVLPSWQAATTKVKALPGGSIALSTRPASALAYVDGGFIGPTPTTAEALTVGTHYVTYKLPGYQRVVAKIAVSSKRQRKLRRRLRRTPRIKELRALAVKLGPSWGRAKAPAELSKLGALVRAQHVVVVKRLRDRRFQTYVYDAYSRRRLAAARTALPASYDRAALAELTRTLYAGIALDRTVVRRAPPPAKPQVRRPSSGRSIFGRWWFWTGVAAAVAIPVIVTSLPESSASCPGGFMCGRLRLGVLRF